MGQWRGREFEQDSQKDLSSTGMSVVLANQVVGKVEGDIPLASLSDGCGPWYFWVLADLLRHLLNSSIPIPT
jgi:hypothetical protein